MVFSNCHPFQKIIKNDVLSKNKRKIDKEVIQFYYQKGMIYECSYDHSVVFVGYDEKE